MQHHIRTLLLLLILAGPIQPRLSFANVGFRPQASTGDGVTVKGYLWNDTNCDGLRQSNEPSLTENALGYQGMSLFYVGVDGISFTRDDTEIGVTGALNGYPAYSFRTGGADGIFYIVIRPKDRPAGYIPSLWQQGGDATIDNDLRLWPDGAWATGTFVIPNLTGFAGGPEAVTGMDIGLCSLANIPRPYQISLPLVRH